MSGTILVRGARQLLTLHGPGEGRRGAALNELNIIRDGALLIEEGRIVEVGPSRRIENLARSLRSHEIDATGRVVMPGFVDCQTQLVRGAPWSDDFEAGIGEEAQSADAHANLLRSASAKRLEARARQWVNGMVRHGTTSLAADCGHGLDQRTDLKILRVLAKLNSAPLDVVSTYVNPPSIPAAHANDSAECLTWLRAEMLPAIRRRSLARFVAFRCGGPVFNTEQGHRFLETARSLGFRIKIHSGKCTDGEAVRLAVEVGAHTLNLAGHTERGDVDLLAKSDAIAVQLPGSIFGQNSEQGGREGASARELIDGGAAVALGTNFCPGASQTYSMQTIVALACAHLGMTPAEAICAATFNAACAIGLSNVAGSLEVGKPADLIVLNASDYREIPYQFGVNLVNRTMKHGVTIYQEGRIALR